LSLPDALPILRDDGSTTPLHRETAGPAFHLLLCGPPDTWDEAHVVALRDRWADLLSVHHLTRDPAPGAIADHKGEAFACLGVRRVAQLLLRPDCHIGFRADDTDLAPVARYPAHRTRAAAPAAPPPPRTPPAPLLRRERPRPQFTRSSLTREAGGRGAASRGEGKGRRGAPAHARSSGVEGKGGRAAPAHARSSRGQGRGAVHRHRSPPFGYHGTMPRENSAGLEKTLRLSNVWRGSRELLAAHRGPLAIGFILMVVNRLTGLVLPASSKFAIDNVLAENRADLLLPLALVVAAATLVQAATGFALAQVVSIAGQRAIANMRRAVQAHVLRLPVRYYDSTKTGVLISRVMTDAEGIRNLVGTGIVQLVGGLFTAVIALGILFYLNWQLTVLTLAVLLTFAGVLVYGFNRLRPIFRKRGEITAEVTSRLAEAFGGNRVVKVYTAERREERIFTKGVHRLFRNIASSITGTSAVHAVAILVVGAVGVLIILVGGNAIFAGTMTLGDLVSYLLFVGVMAAPLIQIAGVGTQISEAF